ncbi:13707_t:CDS:1 [Acaulospora morrowiae]|uniref:13707_t:CDS:1 n=1 Tax=Acaulospora morrowiae TaxID=94023 RepID=A0A9N9G4F2_9GLOM|nr:13707_t:CDS:1 [Acaulospora morrowiae]
MSPGQNVNDNPSNQQQPTTNLMNSYIVHVGEQTFRLYPPSITFDSPNFFTQTFFGEEETSGENETNNTPYSAEGNSASGSTSESNGKDGDLSVSAESNNESKAIDKINKARTSTGTQTSVKEITIDRDPRLFEVILRYLRGYTIFPLSSVNLPPGMSLDLFRESLLEDARFYGLDRLEQLLQAETPSPLRYKDPFTSADKILLSLRDVLIHKDFIKSKLDGSSTIEFFTGAVLTIEVEPSDESISFHTKFLNAQDQKAIEVLGEICGDKSHIQLSRKLYSNMHDTLNGIRLEIDGVQVTGMDIASLVGPYNQKVKTLEDMLRSSGGERLIIYAQEFVFRLDRPKYTVDSADLVAESETTGNKENTNGVAYTNMNGSLDPADVVDSNAINKADSESQSRGEEVNGSNSVDNVKSNENNVNEESSVYLGVVWAKGWTQEWWAWTEYRMKLDALQ